MGKNTRRSRTNGHAEARQHAQAEEVRQSYAEGGQGREAGEGEEAPYVEFENGSTIQGAELDGWNPDVAETRRASAALAAEDFVRMDAALRRLVTEPGETWVLETDEPPAEAMGALATWSQTRGVTLLVFGPGERFSLLSTKPGDTVVLFTAHPEQLNAEVLSAWAQSRGLQLAVMPNEATIQHLDDAALEQMGLQRKNRVLVFPGAEMIPPNLKGPA